MLQFRYFFFLLLLGLQSHAQIEDFKSVNFEKADANAYSNKDENLNNLPLLAYKLTTDLETDVERFRAIYKWVCITIANDYGLYLRNNYKRKRNKDDSLKLKNWNHYFRKKLFKKLLNKKRTICTGYAYLVKELAHLVDLECEIVQGYGRVSTTNTEDLELPNHSWNAIKLNNKWYLADPTWASGIPNPETNTFTFQYNDGFFLAKPELFAINHFPVEEKWWLLDNDIPTFKEFLASPIIYGQAYKNLTQIDAPKYMHHEIEKNRYLSFKYQLKKTINKNAISFLINDGQSDKRLKPTVVNIENKSLTIKHQFKTTGFFDVHLYIGNDLICTYTVKVKR